MTIVDVCELSSDRTATSESTGIPDYTQVFHVISNDDLDGPRTIANAPGIPVEGATYSSGNDVDTRCFLIQKTPTIFARNASLVHWRVVCRYGEWPERDKEDDDPTKWDPELSIDSYLEYSDVSRAEFVGARDQLGALNNLPNIGLTIGDNRPPCHTNGVFYEPKLQKPSPKETIRIAWWSLVYDKAGFDPYKGAVNDVDWNVSWPGLTATYPIRTVRCDGIGGNWEYRNNIGVFRISASFTHDPDGFDVEREAEDFHQLNQNNDGVEPVVLPENVQFPGNFSPGQPWPLDINGKAILTPLLFAQSWIVNVWRTHTKVANFNQIPGLPSL